MTTTIPMLGLAAALAASLSGCIDEDGPGATPWTLAIDGAPATCAEVGAQEVAFKLVRGDSAKFLRFPCDDGVASTTSGDERWLVGALLSAQADTPDPVAISPVVPIDDPELDRRLAAFRFGTLAVDLQRDGGAPCRAVESYHLSARAGELHLWRSARCGQPVVLPEGVDLAIEVVGWIDTGGGELRACHRTAQPAVRSIAGDPAAVEVPFHPAPDAALACAPFAPGHQTPHPRSHAIATPRNPR